MINIWKPQVRNYIIYINLYNSHNFIYEKSDGNKITTANRTFASGFFCPSIFFCCLIKQIDRERARER